MTTPEQPEQIDLENPMTKASETLIATLIHMAECKDMGRGPAPDCPLRKAATEIERLSAENERLREALENGERWFLDYERQHRAKATADGNIKADTNAERAAYFRAALNGERHD